MVNKEKIKIMVIDRAGLLPQTNLQSDNGRVDKFNCLGTVKKDGGTQMKHNRE